jgi:hypothetical protein
MHRYRIPHVVLSVVLCASTTLSQAQQLNTSLNVPTLNRRGTLAPHNFHRHIVGRSKLFPSLPSRIAAPQELFVPFFLSGTGFVPSLVIENIRIDSPITVKPAAILRGEQPEVAFPQVTVAPNGITEIDINEALAAARVKTESIGAIVMRYDFPTAGAIAGFVRNSDASEGLFVNSHSRSHDQFKSTELNAVLWAPHDAGEGSISIVNTSLEIRRIEITFMSNLTSRIIARPVIQPKRVSNSEP